MIGDWGHADPPGHRENVLEIGPHLQANVALQLTGLYKKPAFSNSSTRQPSELGPTP